MCEQRGGGGVNKGASEGIHGERGNSRRAREFAASEGIRGLSARVMYGSSPLASFAHLHGRVNLVVSCVLFVERGDQVEEVVEDHGDGGRGKVGGC